MPPKRKSLRIKEIQDSAVGLIFTLHSTVDAYDIVQTNMATKEKQPIFSLPKIKGIVNREFVEHVVTLYGEWAMGIINKSTIADAIQYFKEVLTIIEGIGLTTLKDVPIAQNATISTIIISALESLKVSAQHAAELCPTNTDIAKLLPAIDISLGRVSSFAHQDTEITIAYYLNAITHTKQLLGTKSTQSSTDLYEIYL